MSLSASAIIVIVVVVSGLVVAIFWSFSAYYHQTSTILGPGQISHEQDLYMRQVRLRTHQSAYAESVFGSATGGDGATTTRTSQVWSNVNSPSTAMPAAAATASAPRRKSSYGQYFQSEKDGGRVNYSSYEGQTDYFDPQSQSPYGGPAYYEYAYEQPALLQQSDEKAQHLPPHQQV